MPLKFGLEVTTSVTCARVALRVRDAQGREAEGWGETPLSVQWVWPGSLPYGPRHEALKRFCQLLAPAWTAFAPRGHCLEVGHQFQEQLLPQLLDQFNRQNAPPPTPTAPRPAAPSAPPPQRATDGDSSFVIRLPGRSAAEAGHSSLSSFPPQGPPPLLMPRLAALVCNSPFDLALHDAFGKLHGRPVYQTYGRDFLKTDLARFLEPAPGSGVSFRDRYPADFLAVQPRQQLPAWHLVGGLDPLEPGDLIGTEPDDGYPVTLVDWIQQDGLKCLKVKLRGNDAAWDYARLVAVGRLALAGEVEWLTADFNCTVEQPAYVNSILDQLRDEHPRLYGMMLYVEQPFPYDLERFPIDVHSVAARKPLFLDESAHDWRMVRLGRELGWTGVALKTCKTQTGALLSACWAKAHGLGLMVQDLTNPMLAQVPHALLAAHAGTIMGVETNAMQFYPAASLPEAQVHPGLYQRRQGMIDLSTVRGPGFGYRLEEIERALLPPATVVEAG